MAAQAKRAAIYFAPDLHKAHKLKAAETSRPVTDLVNEAVRQALAEDAEDLAAFDQRRNEPLVSYEHMINKLRKNGSM